MDDLDDLQPCEFVTDTEDQDSLDERIETEQRLRNQQLWASFQNAACCITKLYKDRAQPNFSPWIPFQNAASNLTTLYKDCIESQKRFAKIGYQFGRRRRMRELKKLIKKHKLPNNSKQAFAAAAAEYAANSGDLQQLAKDSSMLADERVRSVDFDKCSLGSQHQQNQHQHNQHNSNNSNVASILAVNQLNLTCDAEMPSEPMQASQQTHLPGYHNHHHHQPAAATQPPPPLVQTAANQQQTPLGNNEDDLATFQQALAQPTVRGIKTTANQQQQAKKLCSSNNNNNNNTARATLVDPKSEEDRLFELNQFLSEEYHRHVGSRKRTCSSFGGVSIKRLRE